MDRPTDVWLLGIWREVKRVGMSDVCMVDGFSRSRTELTAGGGRDEAFILGNHFVDSYVTYLQMAPYLLISAEAKTPPSALRLLDTPR